ncbi:L-arabinose isomerase [Gilvimarinus xylanilyticus]|uniref:L-arabinose isomerase n=1 Tax=Gilvimarinus xylanilyticus TaxID=2944139 RepID=A0A9X2HZR9_9GAMM|nr:L-arabinose isomerase [Gilvimarinus xylanilyticus]MCP8897680.1 L-arabinose isomerase [Gilvimarinus xylanilyticus]
MKIYGDKKVWFVTGSQHLYGPAMLKEVADNSAKIAAGLTAADSISAEIESKGVVTTPEEILDVCQAANSDKNCVGLILWMHTFSPAKMWIAGLSALNKPYMHLHTQFGAELPWGEIDMHYMNLNQSAHGDREFGYIGTRLRQERKVVVGHWERESVQQQIDNWVRAAMGWNEAKNLRIARFGDNMRQVAVTEGDKVSAQIQFGYEVHAYGLGDLAKVCDAVTDEEIAAQLELYKADYEIADEIFSDAHQLEMLQNEARLELGMERFMEEKGCKAFTNCFENLTGLSGLPGLATQRLMSKGYGYGGEGDWKTAAMGRIVKVMSKGREGGTSFMEDYTYHFGAKDQVLGAHMLEICPSIAGDKPKVVVERHTIGIKKDIARLLFTGATGPALNISTIDMGTRFRIIVNEVDTVEPPADLPHLPVAKALWEPKPSLEVAGAAWIHAGGAHHSVYTQGITTEQVLDFAEMANVETVVIDENTTVREFKQELRFNSVFYHLNQGI